MRNEKLQIGVCRDVRTYEDSLLRWRRWRDEGATDEELEIGANGDLLIRLASSAPSPREKAKY